MSGGGPAAARSLPTVVVSRRARPGREREFERWLRRLAAAARRAPGHAGAELQPPDDQHPGEWVIVYRFVDADRLGDWLESDVRRDLMAEGKGLADGAAREQVLAVPADADPVTALASFRIRADAVDRFAGLYEELLAHMASFDGFLRCELLEPVPGVQDESVVVFSFASRNDLDAWLSSAERREVLARIDPLLDGGRTVNVVGGFGGWFGDHDGGGPKRWKQATVVLAAIFPVALALGFLRREVAPDLGLVPATFISNVVAVAVLTWLLMPLLTRALRGWLSR